MSLYSSPDPNPETEQSELWYWLRERGVPEDAARTVCAQEYTLDELLNHVPREHLAKLQLK